MSTITIRRANIDDISAMLPLMAQLGYPTTLHELEKRFLIFTGTSDYGVAVACTDDNIVGLVAWSKSILF
jgi:hypothetical protein